MIKFPTLVLVLPLLAGCAARAPGPPIPVNDLTLSDDYKLVHGLAEGAVNAPGIPPSTFARMIQLDRAALVALVTSGEMPGDRHARIAARDAISRLADYAAAVSAGNAGAAPPVNRQSGLPEPAR